ncbi:MAG: hypothetical protein IPG50_03215 [Myxococcales bacterium]|nr:hypothetical protein [Myxococcales bacterium]
MRRRALLAVVPFALPLVLATGRVHAQTTANDRAVAEALFQDARQLVNAQEWSRACEKFAESQRLDPKLGTLLYLATCHERQGKLASAWIEFTEARALATRTNQPDREKIAKDRASALEPRLSRIVISAEAQAPGMVIELDGKALSPAVLGSPFPVDAGEHTVSASAPDREPVVLKVTVTAEGQVSRLDVPRLKERVLESDVTVAPVAPPPPPSEPSTPSVRTTGYVLGGVGLASLAIGGAFGLMALGRNNDADAFCSGKFCSAEGLDKHDAAQGLAHASTVGFVVGAALTGVGVYLVLTTKEPPRAASLMRELGTSGYRF